MALSAEVEDDERWRRVRRCAGTAEVAAAVGDVEAGLMAGAIDGIVDGDVGLTFRSIEERLCCRRASDALLVMAVLGEWKSTNYSQ